MILMDIIVIRRKHKPDLQAIDLLASFFIMLSTSIFVYICYVYIGILNYVFAWVLCEVVI